MATQETKPAPDGLKRLDAVLSKFTERLENGDLQPYHRRNEPPARWRCFQSLVEARGIRYANCRLGNFAAPSDQHRLAWDTVLEFTDAMPKRIADGGGLVLLGPPGTGKDHLMMAAMRVAVLDHGFSVLWSDGVRLYARIKHAIADGNTEAMLREFVKPQILALSDPIPPRDSLTAYELAVLRDIVERRYSATLSTWVTTNVTDRKTAEAMFSGAVLDRLLHGATEVDLCGLPSYRLQ